jgi:hypothetical protein
MTRKLRRMRTKRSVSVTLVTAGRTTVATVEA